MRKENCKCLNCEKNAVCETKLIAKENEFADDLRRVKGDMKVFIMASLLIGILIGYSWHYFATKNYLEQEIEKHKAKIVYAENKLTEFMQTKEFKAVNKCNEENHWKAECIAWELNNANRN